MASPLAQHWTLDPGVVFLNHGSFGATPRAVLEVQAQLRARMEAEPVRFFVRELEGLLDAARARLATFLGCDADGLAAVRNATYGVNAVLRSLRLSPGDELLTTDHEYGACRNALDAVAAQHGATVTVALIPFPLRSEDEVLAAVLARVTRRTRLVLIDHVTSPTGLVLPVAAIVSALRERGVQTLIDGAHAAGMLPLDLRALGATYYTGNLHKWTSAPKGAGYLYVDREHRLGVRPLAISHGASSPRTDRSRFQLEFDWTGTDDPTAFLSVPAALDTMAAMVPGGWATVRARNRELALRARDLLCDALGTQPPAPDGMIGSMAAVPLPARAPRSPLTLDPLQDALFARGVEVPIVAWPAPPARLVRISAQLYNDEADYHRLAEALRLELPAGGTI